MAPVYLPSMPRSPALVLTPVARDEAIARLQEHYARNHIEVAAFELRVEKAERATTTAELDAALAGLPVLDGDALVPAERSGQLTKSIQGVLAATTQRGRWRVPSRLVVSALAGSVELDLMEAEIGGAVDVLVKATFGNVRIIVPEGLAVEVTGSALLGRFDHLSQAAAAERDERRLHITGRAVFGSVEIVVRKRPGLLDQVKDFFTGRGQS
jgi:hypothetical protein